MISTPPFLFRLIYRFGLLSLMFVSLSLGAQSTIREVSTAIRHYDVRSGLPDNSVYSVAADERGIIWVGTNKGLSRFDGHHFKSFDRSNGLREETIWKIIPKGRKLLLLHRMSSSEKFSPLIDVFDIYDEAVVSFEAYSGEATPFDWNQVQYCTPLPTAQLGFFLANGAYYLYHPGQDKWQLLELSAGEHLLSADEAAGLYWTQQQENGGTVLRRYDQLKPSSKPAQTLLPNTKYIRSMPVQRGDTTAFLTSFPETPKLLFVWEDKGKLYVRKDSTDLMQFREKVSFVDRYVCFNELVYLPDYHAFWLAQGAEAALLFEDGHLQVINDEKLQHLTSWRRSVLIQDRTIWQCSHSGLYQIDLQQTDFNTAFTNLKRQTGFRDILRFGQELYFSCQDGVLPFRQKDKREPAPILPASMSSAVDPQGRLWAGNHTRLYSYDPASKAVEGFNVPLHEIWSLYADTTGRLWMSELGLYRFDPASGVTEKISISSFPELDNATVYHFYEAHPDSVWLCSTAGLYLLNPYSGAIQRYAPNEEGRFKLHARDVRHVYHDESANVFWLATAEQGLVRWDRSTNESESIFFKGEKSLVLHSVYADADGILWLSSEQGIIQYDPQGGNSRIYSTRDGLNTNEFNRIAHFQDEDGTLYFGSVDGVTYFHPESFTDQLSATVEARPQVVEILQYLDAANKTVNVTAAFLEKQQIVFHSQDRFLTLMLGMEDVRLGQGTVYRYKLKRKGESWETVADQTITLGRMPYGRQTLLVQAILENGLPTTETLEVPILVERPFYLRWWFFLLVVAIGLLVLYLRTRALDRRNQELEAEVKKRTETIARDRELIREQAAELRQLDELKSRFFANLSHELRTPLTLILSPLSQLLEKENRPALRPLIELAHQQSRKMLRLVNDIMDLARLESTTLEVRHAATPLLPLLKQLTSNFELHASREAIRLELDYGLAESLCLQLDAQKTETILYNYLANAIKFTPGGGQITLSARKVEDTLHFEVHDTGRGIPAADLPHIFERYYQSRVFKAVEGGSGLGLALSRELATLLGGKVWAESEAGAGSRLFLQLPWVEAEPVNPLASGSSTGTNSSIAFVSPGDPQTSYRVLIVEDHHDMRNYLLQLLSSRFEVEAVSNGRAALSYLEQSAAPPDLILSDVMMPEMDGYELLHYLKQSDAFSHIPVVMLTARSAMADRLKALRIGVDDYLTKPFVEEELLTRIRNLLRHATMRLPEPEEDTLSDNRTAVAPEKATARQAWLEKTETIVQAHLSEQQFSVDFVAAQMGLSRHTLNRKLRQHTGLTTSQYIQEVRLDYARRLLEDSKVGSVAELSEACGMRDPKYFSKMFKERFGQPPSYYLQ